MKMHLATATLAAALAALPIHAAQPQDVRDDYVRKVPLESLNIPVIPIIPPGSSLDLRPSRAPSSRDQIGGETPLTRENRTPSIGLSIKSPFDGRK